MTTASWVRARRARGRLASGLNLPRLVVVTWLQSLGTEAYASPSPYSSVGSSAGGLSVVLQVVIAIFALELGNAFLIR